MQHASILIRTALSALLVTALAAPARANPLQQTLLEFSATKPGDPPKPFEYRNFAVVFPNGGQQYTPTIAPVLWGSSEIVVGFSNIEDGTWLEGLRYITCDQNTHQVHEYYYSALAQAKMITSPANVTGQPWTNFIPWSVSGSGNQIGTYYPHQNTWWTGSNGTGSKMRDIYNFSWPGSGQALESVVKRLCNAPHACIPDQDFSPVAATQAPPFDLEQLEVTYPSTPPVSCDALAAYADDDPCTWSAEIPASGTGEACNECTAAYKARVDDYNQQLRDHYCQAQTPDWPAYEMLTRTYENTVSYQFWDQLRTYAREEEQTRLDALFAGICHANSTLCRIVPPTDEIYGMADAIANDRVGPEPAGRPPVPTSSRLLDCTPPGLLPMPACDLQCDPSQITTDSAASLQHNIDYLSTIYENNQALTEEAAQAYAAALAAYQATPAYQTFAMAYGYIYLGAYQNAIASGYSAYWADYIAMQTATLGAGNPPAGAPNPIDYEPEGIVDITPCLETFATEWSQFTFALAPGAMEACWDLYIHWLYSPIDPGYWGNTTSNQTSLWACLNQHAGGTWQLLLAIQWHFEWFNAWLANAQAEGNSYLWGDTWWANSGTGGQGNQGGTSVQCQGRTDLGLPPNTFYPVGYVATQMGTGLKYVCGASGYWSLQ